MMLSNRPYLLRAFHQWIVDSKCIPILVLDAKNPRCKVPQDYADGNEIIFNVSNAAVRDLKIGNDIVEFKASFSGIIHIISAPIRAVMAIYAEENGEGLFFEAEEDDTDSTVVQLNLEGVTAGIIAEPQPQMAASEAKGKPFLKLVE